MSLTKQELQERIDASEAHVESLQNELAQQSDELAQQSEALLQIEDLERRVRSLQIEDEVLMDSVDTTEYQIESLALMVDGLARMMAFANATVIAAMHYEGPDPQVVPSLLANVAEELRVFALEFAAGSYTFENILADLAEDEDEDDGDQLLSDDDLEHIQGFMALINRMGIIPEGENEADFLETLGALDVGQHEEMSETCEDPDCQCMDDVVGH